MKAEGPPLHREKAGGGQKGVAEGSYQKKEIGQAKKGRRRKK